MVVAGRRPGKWHVHPSFSVKGAGTLLGPGEFITVEENPDGFSNPVTLEGGSTVNLENYQLPFTWIWLVLTFLIGLAWMIYWTVPKRTVTNLAVTSQIPLNTDGMDYGLITKKDHRNMNWFAIGTALLLVAGWIYQAQAFPTKIPQQIFQFAPPEPAIAKAPVFAEVGLGSAEYDSASQTMTIQVPVTNTGQEPMDLVQFTTTTLKFTTGTGAGPGVMTVYAVGHGRAGDVTDHAHPDHEGPGLGGRAPGPDRRVAAADQRGHGLRHPRRRGQPDRAGGQPETTLRLI